MSRQRKNNTTSNAAQNESAETSDVLLNVVAIGEMSDNNGNGCCKVIATDADNEGYDGQAAASVKEITDNVDYKKLMEEVLLRKAKGYCFEEKTEEFAVVDGEMTLVKRKVSTKYVQPDIGALKALAELSNDMGDLSEMTDEQLKSEKFRLLKLLKMCEDGKNADNVEETECGD